MKHKSRIFLCIAFIFSMAAVFAQDLIVQKNGIKIYCRIVGEDSVSIFYLRKPQKTRFEIKKSEVENYEISNRYGLRKLTQTAPPDSLENKEPLALLSFMGGIAIPLGEFGNNNLADPAAGFAVNGGSFRTALTFKLMKYFGLSASYCYQAHAANADSYASQLSASTFSGFPVTAQINSFTMQGFYAGMCFMLPSKKKKELSFDLDLSLGYPLYTYPETDIQVGQLIIKQYSAEKRAVSFIGKLGLHYKIASFISLDANISCLAGKPKFTNIFLLANNGASYYDNYTQSVSTLNFQLGLSFLLH